MNHAFVEGSELKILSVANKFMIGNEKDVSVFCQGMSFLCDCETNTKNERSPERQPGLN